MMHDHILPQTQQRLPGERTPSRGTPANDEQRLIHPDHVSTKRTKHATRHSLQIFRPKADMSSVFHPRHHGLLRRRRPLHRHARGLRHSTEREAYGVGPGCCGPAPTGRASIYRVISSAAERDDERTSFAERVHARRANDPCWSQRHVRERLESVAPQPTMMPTIAPCLAAWPIGTLP
jgi:hypothetical protein